MTTHPLISRVYGDESADEKKQRVFAIAGVSSTDAEWDVLTTAWDDRLPEWLFDPTFGKKVFHAARCEANRHQFSGRDPEQTKELYHDLVQLIVKSSVKGYGVALDIGSYRQFFPDLPRDVEYYKAFSHVLRHFLERATTRQPVDFTFDTRVESEFNSGRLYDCMVNRPEWKGFAANTVHFSSRKNPRIQVADLVARETMKCLDNRIGPVKRDMRQSMAALDQSLRFSFDLYGKEYFEGYRRRFSEIEKRAGITRETYHGWLRQYCLSDNMSNRYHYLVWLDNKDAFKGRL